MKMFAFLGIVKIILVALVVGGLTYAIYLFNQSKKESHKRSRSLGLIVILVVVLAIFLLGLIRFGNVFAAIWIFNVLTDKISSTTGWDIWLTRAIAIPITAVIIYLLSFIFSFQKKRRQLGYGLLAVLAMMMCLGMFGLTKDTYFNYQTGEAQKWYAVTPDGYCVFDSPGHDPKTGVELKLVTPDIRYQIEKWKKNPNPVKIEVDEKTVFFDMITGEPILWYYKTDDANGNYEFFDKHGTHPKYGVELQPVTKDVVRDWEARKVKAEDEKLKLEKKLKGEEARAKELESDKIKAEKEKNELQNQVKQSRAESEKKEKEKAEIENQQKQSQAKAEKEKQEAEKVSQKIESPHKNENPTPEIQKPIILARISEVDDQAILYVNGTEALKTQWGIGPGDSGWVDITSHFSIGTNELRFWIWNKAVCCYVGGIFEIKKNGISVIKEGLKTHNDSSEGVKFDKTVKFILP